MFTVLNILFCPVKRKDLPSIAYFKMETFMDFINAEIYADHCTRVYMYNKYLKSHPHIFRHSTLKERPATSKDYYVPPKIADKCIVSDASFDEIGCQKIACFPKKRNLENCKIGEDTVMLTLGQWHTMACQPACQFISTFVDTDFRDGKCFLSNLYKKAFALFPEQVEGSQTVQPMHVGFNLTNGDLHINSTYCKYYGLGYKPSTGDCAESPHQTVLETIIGTSFYRSIQRSKYKHKTYPLPPVPPYMQNAAAWLEGMQPPKSRSKRNVSAADITQDLVREVAIDFNIDITLNQLSKIFKKRVPRTLQAISAKLYASKTASNLTKIALADVALKSQFNIATNVSKVVGRGFSAASSIFSVFSIISFIVDLFDPFNFLGVLDKTTLAKINDRLDFEFFGNHIKNIEISPDHIYFLLEEDQSDYANFKIERMHEYMMALAPDRQLPAPKKEPFKFLNVYCSIVTVTLVLLAAILVEQIAYIALVFFAFRLALVHVNSHHF